MSLVFDYRAASRWTREHRIVDDNRTTSSSYRPMTPAWRPDSRFPGSMYAIDIKKPGPVKAHNLNKLNPSYLKKKWTNNSNWWIKIGFKLFGFMMHSLYHHRLKLYQSKSLVLNPHCTMYFHLMGVHFHSAYRWSCFLCLVYHFRYLNWMRD